MAFSPISLSSPSPRIFPQAKVTKQALYFGHGDDAFSDEVKVSIPFKEELAVLLTPLRSADSLKKKGNAYVFPKKGSKNLKMADYFYEATLNKYQPSYRKTEALEMAETLLKQFKDEDGIADVAMKYFDAHIKWNRGEGQVEVAEKLFENPNLSFKDRSTFRDKGVELLSSTLNKDSKESALEAYLLLIKQDSSSIIDFKGLSHLLLAKAEEQGESAVAHKQLGDIYYKGNSITYIHQDKALAHYEQYLQTLEQFNGEETKQVLKNILDLQSDIRTKTGRTLAAIDELRHLIYSVLVESEPELELKEKGENPFSPKVQLANFETKASQVFKVISELPKGTPLPFSE